MDFTRTVAVTLVIDMLLVFSAVADIIEVPLPDLIGIYTINDMSRSVTFDLGYSLQAVNGAWIYWSGTITPGFGCGDGELRPRDDCFTWDCQVSSSMGDPASGFWYAYVGPVDGGFDETTPLEGFLSSDWDFLLDGTAGIRISLAPYIIIGGDMIIAPEATIEDAVLVLDAEVISPTLEATVAIEPKVLNLRSRGSWVTCYIELPAGCDPAGIDIATVTLNDSLYAETRPGGVGDHDGDGIPDLMAKFSRTKLIEILRNASSTEVWVRGEVDGQIFAGTDTIRVLCTGLQARFQNGTWDSGSVLLPDGLADQPRSSNTSWGQIKAEFGEGEGK